MFTTVNGWTKDSIVAHIEAHFTGKSFVLNPDTHKDECKYRGPNGEKCAVGLFIPDDKYRPSMDINCENHATGIIERYRLSNIMPLDIQGMQAFQQVHDNSTPSECKGNMLAWVRENVSNG